MSYDPAGQFASGYVGMGNMPTIMVDPDGEFAFVPVLLIAAKAAAIGAGLGAAGYTASVGFSDGGFSNWNWGQFGKSAAIGAVSGVVTAGIGSAFGAVGGGASSFGGKLAYEGMRAVFHGFSGTLINGAFGNQVSGASFAAGALGSLVGSGLSGFSTAAQIGGAALSGGIGAELTGGDFFQGAATGATVAGLNHGVHGLINLGRRDAGQQLAREMRKLVKARKPVNLEDIVDINSKLSETYGYGPITNSTSGVRMIFGKRVKMTIWMRTDLKGDYLYNNSDNKISGIEYIKGAQNAYNRNIYSRLNMTNGSGNSVINFEVINNVSYMERLYRYIGLGKDF